MTHKNSLPILFLLCFSFLNLSAKDIIPVANKGVLDLRQTAMINTLKLNGEWAFYWKKFINPEAKPQAEPDVYYKVPSYWTQYKEAIPEVSRFGYGSYQLRILFPENYSDTLSLSVPVFDTSFEIFVNGEKIGGNGIVGTNAETSSPAYGPFLHDFIIDTDEMNIVIHVSNFDHRRGGFWKTMYIGQKEQIHLKNERSKIFSDMLMGILFGSFLLFLVFYLFEKKNLSFLYFSLTSFGMYLRLMNTGFYAGTSILPMDWDWIVRLEYIGTYMTYIFGILYFSKIFPKSVKPSLIKINTIVYSTLLFLLFFFKVSTYSYAIYLLELTGTLFLIAYTVSSFKLMLKGKRIEAIFFFSLLIFILTLINDTLVSYSSNIITTDYLLPLAFFLLIGTHSLILVAQWVSTYKEKTALFAELQHINNNLENIIKKRTLALNESNQELQTTLDFKNRMYSIIAHDLKSPVATLAQYVELLYNKYEKTEDETLFVNLRQLSFSSIDLIDNLLTWGSEQGQKMLYRPELYQVKKACLDIQGIFIQQFEHKNIQLSFEISPNIKVWCDIVLLKITIRNLISNAMKFTPSGGKVTFTAEADGENTKFTVSDTGVGMDKIKIGAILNKTAESTRGTNGEKGTGLGLIVVKDLVTKNKGTLCIESNPGRGTWISFTLPGKP